LIFDFLPHHRFFSHKGTNINIFIRAYTNFVSFIPPYFLYALDVPSESPLAGLRGSGGNTNYQEDAKSKFVTDPAFPF